MTEGLCLNRPQPAQRGAAHGAALATHPHLRFDRIVALEPNAPNPSMDLVWSGCTATPSMRGRAPAAP